MTKLLRRSRKGFTLIETLTTIAVVGVLAAVTIPVITRQLTAGDASQIQQDTDALRKAIELFNANGRPHYPGDVDDLVNSPTSADKDIAGAAYTTPMSTAWKGPYIERSITNVGEGTGNAFPTGFSASIEQDFRLCSAAISPFPCDAPATNDYVGIYITNLVAEQALQVNNLIDGEEASYTSTGRFRYNLASSTGIYLSFGYAVN